MQRKKIPTLSLFSGAGGLDLGFEQAGFEILACVEIEKTYCQTLEKNIASGAHFSKQTQLFNIDIREFDPKPFRSSGIRCIIGGPPCQTFSAAGRRSGGVIGTEDDRGQLYNAYCRILDALKPEVFVFENVYGLPGANGGGPWQEIISAFRSHGYTLRAEVVDAADYGVPQHRERLIMVGFRKGDFVFPMPTHGPDSNGPHPLVSVKEAILDLQANNEPFHNDLGGLYGHLLPEVPEGLNYAFFTAEMGHPEPVFAWRSKFHDLLYKVNRDEPCRTIKAQPGKFTGPFHWKNRHFTVAELRRLQSFPDDYELVGSSGKVLEQIGNSVPPRLAFVIATSVREQLLEPRKRQTFKLRPEGFSSTFRQRQRDRSERFKAIAAREIARKYGNAPVAEIKTSIKPKTTSYKVSYSGLFERKKLVRSTKANKQHATVQVTDFGGRLRVDYDFADEIAGGIRMSVEMSGLRKYLPGYDSLHFAGTLRNHEDIFHAWQEIEEVLVGRSKFFTLIDIYGHYANRGDVVNISTTYKFPTEGPLERFLEYFSQTANCGDFHKEGEVIANLETTRCEFSSVVSELRALRFDFRTGETHPIIGKYRVLCTYPFPLLSPRALVESRVSLGRKKDATYA